MPIDVQPPACIWDQTAEIRRIDDEYNKEYQGLYEGGPDEAHPERLVAHNGSGLIRVVKQVTDECGENGIELIVYSVDFKGQEELHSKGCEPAGTGVRVKKGADILTYTFEVVEPDAAVIPICAESNYHRKGKAPWPEMK